MSLHLGAQFGNLVGELSIHRSTTRLLHRLPQPVTDPIKSVTETASIGLVPGMKMARYFHTGHSRDGGVNVLMTQTNHRPVRGHDKGVGSLTPFTVGARVDDNDPPSVTPRRHGNDVTRIEAGQRVGDLTRAFTFAQSCLLVFQLPNLCLLYTSPSPRDRQKSRMPSSA